MIGAGGKRLRYGELAEAAMALPVPEQGDAEGPEGLPPDRQADHAARRRAKSSGRQAFGIDMRAARAC